MASLKREVLEREIAGADAAVKAHKEGMEVNKIVLDAFKKRLSTYPEKKKPVKRVPIGVA